IQSATSFYVDEAFTESMMTYCRATLGPRCVLANNSIRSTSQGTAYTSMYNKMKALGRPLAFQTAAPDRIGVWQDALDFAISLGANSIELARDYDTYDPTQLEARRQELLTCHDASCTAVFTYPLNGALSVDTTRPFVWSTLYDAEGYQLTIGTSEGAADLVNSGDLAASQSSYAVPALPTGQVLWARIAMKLNGSYDRYQDVSFTAAPRS